MIIGAVALIVVGPKDLPVLMRRVGQFVGKMRGMAAEFRASFDELARQSELEDLRREVEAMRADHRSLAQFNPLNQLNPQHDPMSAEHAAMGFNPDEINTPPPPETPHAVAAEPEPAPDPAPPKPPRARKSRAKTSSAKAK
jgi:sec-independent protein translocase protein TatB